MPLRQLAKFDRSVVMVMINALLGSVPGRPKELKTEIENPCAIPHLSSKSSVSRELFALGGDDPGSGDR